MRVIYIIAKNGARVTDHLHSFKGLDIDDCQYPITCIRIVAFSCLLFAQIHSLCAALHLPFKSILSDCSVFYNDFYRALLIMPKQCLS